MNPLRTFLPNLLAAQLTVACGNDSESSTDGGTSSTEEDAAVEGGDASVNPADDPLCRCGCVELRNANAETFCEFNYGQLTSGPLQVDLPDLRFKVGDLVTKPVDSKLFCAQNHGGFYVDSAEAPTTLTLCPDTCQAARSMGRGLFGSACGDPSQAPRSVSNGDTGSSP